VERALGVLDRRHDHGRRLAEPPHDGALGDAVAFAQIGIVGLDGQIELEALRLCGLPEAAPALLCGTPTLPVGQREFQAETTLDLPNLAAGAVHLIDFAAPGKATAPKRRSKWRIP
jgi:hypothetical protein